MRSARYRQLLVPLTSGRGSRIFASAQLRSLTTEQPNKQQQKQQPKQQQQQQKQQKGDSAAAAAAAADATTSQQLGIDADKYSQFSDWYTQVCTRTEMMDYYDVSGCYILRPWSFSIWESIREFFDSEIKKLGVQNAYFPLFISEKALTTEKDHVEGFSPEVAWVTRAGPKDVLSEPVAVRPTSETAMYPAYARWIRSHRDLPLKLNQWSNVVRWEFKHPTPFIRSREFLWQEGHTAFATKEEAEREVLQILDLYARVYEELLAVPVIKGFKSEKEKFAGGLYTTTVEAFIPPRGWAIQAATSHCLGQNFAKMFNIKYESEEEGGKFEYVWQNSWGLTTRSIGVMIMVHGDNKGLVLPPRVAPIQVVIVPIINTKIGPESAALVKRTAAQIEAALQARGIRVKLDDRDNYNTGWKYNQWEMKGVPLRIEIGLKDIEKSQVVVARRDTMTKEPVAWGSSENDSNSKFDNLVSRIADLMHAMQREMLEKARKDRDAHMCFAATWDEFMAQIEDKKMVRVPWCCEPECEEQIKVRSVAERSSAAQEQQQPQQGQEQQQPQQQPQQKVVGAAKSLCIPFDQSRHGTATATATTKSSNEAEDILSSCKCFACARPAKKIALFGRSY